VSLIGFSPKTDDLKRLFPDNYRKMPALVSTASVAMPGHNPSAPELTKVVIFYVNTADTPFLDPLHH
jgi:hypothetical protein